MSKSIHPRVAILGLDGATLDLIQPWAEAGLLPNFARLMAAGARGTLHSTIHPISPQAWSSFITGKNAGKHGLYDFLVKSPGSYQFALTHGGHRRGTSLWQYLSAAGKRVIVLNVPFTYPPEPVNGLMLSGFDAPRCDSSIASPPELLNEIQQAVGTYFLHEMYPVGRKKAEYEEVLCAEVRNRFAVTRYLHERYDWDFFMVVVNATDLVQHLFWAEMEDPASPYQETILHVYQAVDAALGDWWNLFGEQVNFLVISDHGAGPIRKTIYLNEWLQQAGFLTFRSEQQSTLERVTAQGLNQLRMRLKQSLPRGVKDWLKQKIPDIRNRVESWLQTSAIDWSRTEAFAGGNFGNIYINLEGREAQGIVPPDDYPAVVAQIREALTSLRDPETGELLVEAVYHRDELYVGPYRELAPDLLVVWRDYAYFVYPTLGGNAGTLFGPAPQEDATEFIHSGTHRVNGILLATGPDLCATQIEGAHITDLAPTLLHLYGLPVPDDMDGRVLQELLARKRPVIYCPADVPEQGDGAVPPGQLEETPEIVERLRSLGYLE
ncbi:MAG: phosphodiesterase [Litorilinea sp.]|nr:MAG: phosphodiesterase [Litorilinea sp.]